MNATAKAGDGRRPKNRRMDTRTSVGRKDKSPRMALGRTSPSFGAGNPRRWQGGYPQPVPPNREWIESKDGRVTVPVMVTDELTPGTVALPHGWGHRGGWQLANRHAGANVNLLAGARPADLEPLAGMAS